ncbi:MAG: hypothetical protein WC986_14650 [Elusimicrobiota bacterium]|jgi:hypothetical protein
MTFAEFQAFAAIRPSHAWRKGQTAFNALWEKRPDLADKIRATAADPFYDDSKLPTFWTEVQKHWSAP